MDGNAPLVQQQPQTPLMRWVHRTFLLELPSHLRWAYLWFGFCLILLIGSQGFIFPVRTSLFYDIIENKFCPPDDHRCDVASKKDAFAKAMLPLVQLPLVMTFNFLWASTKSPKFMITFVCTFFTLCFIPVWIGMAAGAAKDIDHHVYTHDPWEEWLAYFGYYSVELKAVICPVMIWCVVNDLTPPKLAKIAYPPIVFAIQVGTIIGAFMAARVMWFGGNEGLVIIQVFCLVLAGACGVAGVSAFRSGPMPEVFLNENAPAAADAGGESLCRSLASMFEGLALIATHPYLLGTAICSVAHLVPRMFLDFQGTQVIKHWCNVNHYDDYSECKTSFFGWVNLIQSLLTMFLALLGTRKIVEIGGLRLSLSVLPMFAIVGNLVTFLTIWGLGTPLEGGGLLPNLWITQVSIIMMNTFGYGLNGPSREMLYTKCARDMKYKAKSWSDMYGNSAMKSLASVINGNFATPGHVNAALLATIASGWVAAWVTVAQGVGIQHKKLMESGKVVGEDGVGRCCN